jgi:hypothetical protein
MGLDNTINVNMLNEFSAVTVSAAGVPDLTKVYITSSNIFPTGYNGTMNGLTNSAPGLPTTITLTASALTARDAGYKVAYTDVNGTTGQVMSGPFTAEEFMVMIAAHEASHTHGIGTGPAGEAQAAGYGVYAVQQYRQLPAGACP